MSLETKTHEPAVCDRIDMCSRPFVLVIEHYCSLVGFSGKREYLVSCTAYGSLTKTRVVRWSIYLENGSTWQAVLHTVR